VGPLFDRYVVVDWSASSTPTTGKDSIWSCVFDPATGRHDLENHPTRRRARAHLIDVLRGDRGRVLIGFDFPYGFPRGFAEAAQLDGPTRWQAAWQHLRFEVAAALNATISDGPGPFWGTSADRHVTPHLSRTKAPGFPHAQLAEFRANEMATRATGRYPFSVWQLTGAGSVGSQAMTGIPVLSAVRSHPDLAERSMVWPFETGLTADPTGGRDDAIVHAEIWPSGIAVDRARHPVKDAAQVIGLCEHLARQDRAGELAAEFTPDLDPATRRHVLEEEGWIVGAHQPQRAGRWPM
jgi:precorrin-8X/cobalt-precorrin-8 methylmutase